MMSDGGVGVVTMVKGFIAEALLDMPVREHSRPFRMFHAALSECIVPSR